jgi:hypothetical protein
VNFPYFSTESATPVEVLVMLHSVSSPPTDSRTVVLRFDDNGERDAPGFYWSAEGSWYTSLGSAVHPVGWIEYNEAKYEVVDLLDGRVVFSDCTIAEAHTFRNLLSAYGSVVIVPA